MKFGKYNEAVALKPDTDSFRTWIETATGSNCVAAFPRMFMPLVRRSGLWKKNKRN